jgi:uncharacterized YigZ family protein
MDVYPTVDGFQRFELEVKRSRFITSINSVEGRAEALKFIQQIRDEMPTASHHCWTFVAARPDDVNAYDQSDDGEPKGSAGKPMLNVLLHSGFGNTVVVVTRYFGGVKLGVGGLMRAYALSVSDALKQVKTAQKYIHLPLLVKFPYDFQGRIDFFLSAQKVVVADKIFTDVICYQLQIPQSTFESTCRSLIDMTQGRLEIIDS